MKVLKTSFLLVLVEYHYGISVNAQGTLENLNFESANVSPASPGQFPNLVPIDVALPDWVGYLGSAQQTQVEYNVMTEGAANIALLGPTWSSTEPGIIDGNYSVLLQAGAVPNGFTGDAIIEQTGTIPANAESIEFKAWEYGSLSDLGIWFSGNSLAPVLISSGSTYNTYAVNIAPYAGQTGVLEFGAIFNSQGPTLVNLDDISFSPQSVPEPGPMALAAAGGLLFGLYRRFAASNKSA
jgi:hypothetical protein